MTAPHLHPEHARQLKIIQDQHDDGAITANEYFTQRDRLAAEFAATPMPPAAPRVDEHGMPVGPAASADFWDDTADAAKTPGQPTIKEMLADLVQPKNLFWMLATVVSLVYLFTAGPFAGTLPKTGDKYNAQSACKRHIEAKLKAPSTAKFDLDTRLEGKSYKTVGTVDAQNSFGASMRNNVYCVSTYNDATKQWSVISSIG